MRKISGKELIDFWQSKIAISATSARFAADLTTACREVLGEQANNVDVVTEPPSTLLDRLAEKRPDLSRQTLAAYRSRFKKAVRLYLAYLESPQGWPGSAAPRPKTQAQWRRYEFPLRRSGIIAIDLPLDISKTEASRLSMFVQSLVAPK